MRYLFTIAVIFITMVFVFAIAIYLAHADNKVTAPDFSSYPQSIRGYLNQQADAAVHLKYNSLLEISTFPDPRVLYSIYCSVANNGREDDGLDSIGLAFEGIHIGQLSDEKLQSLRAAIQQLPPENKLPPIERLVVVSFKDGSNWMTYSYDNQNLPQVVSQIYDIIGERFKSLIVPPDYYEPSIEIKPDPNQPIVTATITNGDNKAMTLWSGMRDWYLIVIGSDGKVLLPTQAAYEVEQSNAFMPPQKVKIPLMPGMSISKVFDIRQYYILETQGTFYIYVRRFVTMGGRNGGFRPVESPVLKLTFHVGKPPVWEVAPTSAIPEPKFQEQYNDTHTAAPTKQN